MRGVCKVGRWVIDHSEQSYDRSFSPIDPEESQKNSFSWFLVLCHISPGAPIGEKLSVPNIHLRIIRLPEYSRIIHEQFNRRDGPILELFVNYSGFCRNPSLWFDLDPIYSQFSQIYIAVSMIRR